MKAAELRVSTIALDTQNVTVTFKEYMHDVRRDHLPATNTAFFYPWHKR